MKTDTVNLSVFTCLDLQMFCYTMAAGSRICDV